MTEKIKLEFNIEFKYLNNFDNKFLFFEYFIFFD